MLEECTQTEEANLQPFVENRDPRVILAAPFTPSHPKREEKYVEGKEKRKMWGQIRKMQCEVIGTS